MPRFTINTTTDILLKRDADQAREIFFIALGEGRTWSHDSVEHEEDKWTNSMQYGLNEHYFNTVHEETNIKQRRAHDVFLNTQTGQPSLTTKVKPRVREAQKSMSQCHHQSINHGRVVISAKWICIFGSPEEKDLMFLISVISFT